MSRTVTFEDLFAASNPDSFIPDGYEGFTWTTLTNPLNFGSATTVPAAVLDVSREPLGSTYAHGIVSGQMVALNSFNGSPTTISWDGPGTFNFESGSWASAFDATETLQFQGWLDGSRVDQSGTYTINNQTPTEIDLNWDNIDKLVIISTGQQWALDNFTFSIPWNGSAVTGMAADGNIYAELALFATKADAAQLSSREDPAFKSSFDSLDSRWHPLTTSDLETNLQEGDLQNGQFTNGDAQVHAAIGDVQNAKTLVLSFGGHGDPSDLLGSLTTTFFEDFGFLNAVDSYVQEAGVQQVLVTGQGFGGVMAQLYMAEHPDSDATHYIGATFGSLDFSSLGDTFPTGDTRLLQFANTSDSASSNTGEVVSLNPASEHSSYVDELWQLAEANVPFLPDDSSATSGVDGTHVIIGRFDQRNNLTGNTPGPDKSEYLIGGQQGDVITGGSQNDYLAGLGGKDQLDGGQGSDTLVGGAGKDTFHFGPGYAQSGNGTDTIQDFSEADGDRINLRDIDADLRRNGNQSFHFIGSDQFSAAGQIRFDADTHTLYGNTHGDGGAEFEIHLPGVTSLTAFDFLL